MLIAAGMGREEVLELLLQHDADIEAAADNGVRPLSIAAWKAQLVAVQTLISSRAAVNRVREFAKKSAASAASLDHAKFQGHESLINSA